MLLRSLTFPSPWKACNISLWISHRHSLLKLIDMLMFKHLSIQYPWSIHIDTDSLCFLILFLWKTAKRFNTSTLFNSLRVSGEFLPRLRSDDMAGLCYHIRGQALRRYCPWPPRRYLWTEGSIWDRNGWSDIEVYPRVEEMDVLIQLLYMFLFFIVCFFLVLHA